jgi:ribosomal protein S18 acetylase RimI-like enzyme
MCDAKVSNVVIREAAIADCPAVAGVHVQSWRASFAGIVPQAFLDKMSVDKRARAFERDFSDSSYRMYVAELPEPGVIGFADFGEAREPVNAHEGELYAIYLLSEFQRQGIGERLFNRGVEFLIESGKSSMQLLALEVSPYKSFYEKMGGRVIGRTQVEIGGVMFDELVYGWDNLRRTLKMDTALRTVGGDYGE